MSQQKKLKSILRLCLTYPIVNKEAAAHHQDQIYSSTTEFVDLLLLFLQVTFLVPQSHISCPPCSPHTPSNTCTNFSVNLLSFTVTFYSTLLFLLKTGDLSFFFLQFVSSNCPSSLKTWPFSVLLSSHEFLHLLSCPSPSP